MNTQVKNKKRSGNEERIRRLWRDYWYKGSDEETVRALVEQYLPLVRNMVHGLAIRYYGRMSEQEMMSAGVMGLHEAIRRFPKQSEKNFNRFAVCRIRGAILDELRRNDPLNRYQRKMIRRLQETAESFVKEQARAPTNGEIAERCNMSETNVENYLGLDEASISLEEEIEDGCCLEEVLEDEKIQGPREAVDSRLNVEMIRKSLQRLPERDQKILYLRYYEELSVKEIASVLDVTSGRVSQLYNAAIAKMRAIMKGGSDHVLNTGKVAP